MTQVKNNPLEQTVDELRQFNSSLLLSISLFHLLGYGLLVLALFDLIEMFVPVQFMNPVWEFQTIGGIVERVPVPLIGLVLVFLGEFNGRSKWEVPLLKFLSWSTLLAGVLFFLLIPLGIVNTMRIEKQNNTQITTQVEEQMTQMQQVKNALEQATTSTEMEQLLSTLDSQGRTPEIKDVQQLEKMKEKLSDFIASGEKDIKTQAKENLSSRRWVLLKSSVKWNLGALISSFLFISIWRGTSWARDNNYES
ncbi:MAG: hypothetical protein F6K58_01880 [Symploca sp. SIO2E9]|nr:hypothetical protein [Symploca sp. SIO2E9]